ncbi:MAG TPA: hypothetical protein VN844_28000 [Pyrinomonadaceae bacterium]|nr:hypothetical protein [Pyrinomonadaceae bacterium]
MRTKTSLTALPFLLFLLPLTICAQYENQGYSPLTNAEISKKFPVTHVGTMGHFRPGYFEGRSDKPLPGTLNIGPFGAVIKTTSDDEDLLIAGDDKRKQEWSVQLGLTAYFSRFYEADLDRNGIRDAVIVFPTGGNGLAPTSHILTITFDENGRPVTFEADGYFQESNGKIFDLVDLNRNGRAELIYMNFDDGYWITSIYEVRNARWQRIVGRHASRTYPLYTRFTFKENHKATVPKRGRHPFTPDLSNRSPRIAGRLVSYQWADVHQSEDIVLTIKDKQGRVVSSKPISWYSSFTVVLDSREGRKIISLSANAETVKALLDTISAGNYEVALYGQRSPDGSSPEMLWARPVSN